MTFKDTLYARDDEMDEFGDTGSAAYGDSLEEDYEQEEEEEEAEMPGMTEPGSQPATPGAPTRNAVEGRRLQTCRQKTSREAREEKGSQESSKKKTCQETETSSQTGQEENGQKKTGKESKTIGSP